MREAPCPCVMPVRRSSMLCVSTSASRPLAHARVRAAGCSAAIAAWPGDLVARAQPISFDGHALYQMMNVILMQQEM
eukprot:1543694-Pleurochrysis_carterae.AAC.3